VSTLRQRELGMVDYLDTLNDMRQFTDSRIHDSADEVWLLQHPPTFTQGQAGKSEHVLCNSDIPIVQSDRGGQITYHGPGQLVAYVLLDLRRAGLSVRQLVTQLEHSIIAVLAEYAITALGRPEAPGVYVSGQKIAALGLRVRKGCCYHGIALNVNPDLTPFSYINPCGWANQPVTSMERLGVSDDLSSVGEKLLKQLDAHFG